MFNLRSISKATEYSVVGQTVAVNKETHAQPGNSVLNIDTVTSGQAWPALPSRGVETSVQSAMTSSGNSNARLLVHSRVEPTCVNDVRSEPGGGHLALHSENTETRWSAMVSTPQSSNRFALLAIRYVTLSAQR